MQFNDQYIKWVDNILQCWMETTKIIYLFAKLRAAPKGLCLVI